MKKITGILVALVFVLAYCTMASAETETGISQETAITETSAETAAETTVETVSETAAETTPAETAETAEPDSTAASEEETLTDEPYVVMDNPEIYYAAANADADTAEGATLYKSIEVPKTGSASGGIAVFTVLSAEAAAAYVSAKKKA